ncbi:hypothetical protein GGQ79_004680 [Ochrobactrum pecoris]|uniref:Uncharacterized protein n=1 Tax=Brucella pecoris TaxID=867683 RepID=A0AB34YZA7_9HYPH|nr:hypothetical protein [Brucella pecoris]
MRFGGENFAANWSIRTAGDIHLTGYPLLYTFVFSGYLVDTLVFAV